jgi:hypothetical protein
MEQASSCLFSISAPKNCSSNYTAIAYLDLRLGDSGGVSKSSEDLSVEVLRALAEPSPVSPVGKTASC